jgi:ribosomal protein S19E (S16A)
VDKELFNCIGTGLKANLLHLLLTTNNDQFNIRALVAAVLRKLPLNGELVASELKKMVGDNDKKITQPRRSTRYPY